MIGGASFSILDWIYASGFPFIGLVTLVEKQQKHRGGQEKKRFG
ncbi:hypothetical protein [Brevibacillus parabrevis]|nr:hypothetical protein [Brevibacillus parabrevis]